MSKSTIFTILLDKNRLVFIQIYIFLLDLDKKLIIGLKKCCRFASKLRQMIKEEKLIGRQREWVELQWALDSNRSEFVVMYGRRRIGKTFLVRRFFNDTYSFHYVGAHRQKKNVQLQNFREALSIYSGDKNIPKLKNWHEAFLQLEEYLQQCKEKRKVVFFDEMPWIDTQGSFLVQLGAES